MDVQYNAAAIRQFLDDLDGGRQEVQRTVDGYQNAYQKGVSRYNRLSGELQQRIALAQRHIREAQDEYDTAEIDYENAMRAAAEAEDPDEAERWRQRADQARIRMDAASETIRRESAVLSRHQQKMSRLSGAWNSCMGQADMLRRSADEAARDLQTAASGAARDLQEFSRNMEQLRSELQEGSTYSGVRGNASGYSAGGSGYGGGFSGGGAGYSSGISGGVSANGSGSRSGGFGGSAKGSSGAAFASGAVMGAAGAMGAAAASGSRASEGRSGGSGGTFGRSTSGSGSAGGSVSAAQKASGGASSGTAAGSAGTSDSRRAAGWCPRHSMCTVSVAENGSKYFGMNIGGEETQFRCNRAGAAKAYRAAVATGDADLIARTSAIFEVEVLRADLELEAGEAGVPQLGGYHRDVRKQDPQGYESHHIPARSVQDVNAEWLPTISISNEDHALTSSYRGRQSHIYKPYFPDGVPNGTYKQEISDKIAQGGSGYIEAMRNEVYDLRVTTGHRYDGGISAYLDAVVDMIASRGIPESK